MALVDSTWYTNSVGYAAISVWSTGATIVAGALRRQTAPAVGSERVFVCIIAGTTNATTEPTWVLTRGAKTVDNTVTWQECTGQAALNGDLTNTATWAQVKAATPAVLGQIIKRSNNASYQICTTAGAMSASEPAFSNTAGVTTTDTTAVWTSLGAVSNFTGGQAPHARLANAGASTWFVAGNTVYVGDNHAESQASAITLTALSSHPLIGKFLCHNHSGSYPPAAGDLMTGASIATTGVNNIGLGSAGATYYYGLTFKAGSGLNSSSAASIVISAGPGGFMYFDNCSFRLENVNAANSSILETTNTGNNPNSTVFNNCTVYFGSINQVVTAGTGQFVWQNTGQVLASGSVVPTTFFQFGTVNTIAPLVIFEALDLSQLTGNLQSYIGSVMTNPFLVKDCKLNAAVTIVQPATTSTVVQIVRCDSSGTTYKSARYAYEGTETTETSIVRTGGAIDPTGQAQSRKIVTTANSQWLRPFKAEPYAVWNPRVGANVTVTVCGTVNAGALPNNDDIWLECEYLGGDPAAFATWNPADLSGMTLTGSNLIATGGNFTGVRGNQGKGSGKYYFEITATTVPSAFIGLALSTANLTSGTSAGAVGVNGTGAVEVNGSNAGVSINAIGGQAVGIAVDLTNGLIWFRGAAGSWNAASGSANNPATGTGGISISAIAGTLFPWFISIFGGTQTVTANFGATTFSGAVPSGFTSGWFTPVNASPLGKIVTTTKSSVLASNAAVASDGSTWGGGGSGAGWSPFKLVAALSSPQPQLAGYLHARVRVAKPSTTYYIDPQITLS